MGIRLCELTHRLFCCQSGKQIQAPQWDQAQLRHNVQENAPLLAGPNIMIL